MLLYVHPTALVALLFLMLGRGEWPRRWITLGWMFVPAFINPFLWDAGCHLFGFQFGGLGAVMYVFAVLPLNALVLGISVPQFLHSRLASLDSEGREFAVGILIEIGVLFANLAVLSRLATVVSNVSS